MRKLSSFRSGPLPECRIIAFTASHVVMQLKIFLGGGPSVHGNGRAAPIPDSSDLDCSEAVRLLVNKICAVCRGNRRQNMKSGNYAWWKLKGAKKILGRTRFFPCMAQRLKDRTYSGVYWCAMPEGIATFSLGVWWIGKPVEVCTTQPHLITKKRLKNAKLLPTEC